MSDSRPRRHRMVRATAVALLLSLCASIQPVADLDGDGPDDLIMVKANYGTNQTRFYTFTGSGSAFSQANTLRDWNPAGIEDHAVVGDFDNDGQIDDIAVAYPGGTGVQVRVFTNAGATGGGIWSDTTGPLPSSVEGRMAVADLDGE